MNEDSFNFDFIKKDTFIIVFKLPKQLPSGFCFSPKPVEFLMVDWFNSNPDLPREDLIKFIKNKIYYKFNYNYLVVGRNGESFIISETLENRNESTK